MTNKKGNNILNNNEKEKEVSVVIDEDIYKKMLNSSAVLVDYIRHKHEMGLFVSEEEANFVNDFGAYGIELNRVLKEMEIE